MSKKCVYALGFFDGVHLGHGSLLLSCRELADELECDAGVITFDTHPEALLLGQAPGLINTLADRDRILREQYHIDTVISLPFDRAMLETPWQDFFRRLVEEFSATGLICGEDFRFGHKGLGNSQRLLEACREAGIPCIVAPQMHLDNTVISSTHIRNLIEMGLVEHAYYFLGHYHTLSGKVVPGHQLGRRLGFPTANLKLPAELVAPKFGVYACRCTIDGKRYASVTNVGNRPTVDGADTTVESWIQGYSGDLYGREITLEFIRFLRPEIRFPGLEHLQDAVRSDAEKTKEILNPILP